MFTIRNLLDELRTNPNISGLEPVYINWAPHYPDGSANVPQTTYQGLHCWRASYNLPSLGFQDQTNPPKTARDLVRELETELKESHRGWKGGEYRFTDDQQVWMDRVGTSSYTLLVGVTVDNGMVLLEVAMNARDLLK